MYSLDRYTPHGYLDNPAHAWKIPGPGGVLRSRPAIGMGWHYPALAASYNRTRQYTAFLQTGFIIAGGTLLLDGADFKKAGIELYCDYHSKNILRYRFRTPGDLQFSITYFLADAERGNVLACIVKIENPPGGKVAPFSILGILDYERSLGQGLTWESGMFARAYAPDPDGELVALLGQSNCTAYGSHTIGVYQEGTHFHLLGLSQPGTSPVELENISYTALSGLNELRNAVSKASHTQSPAHVAGHLLNCSRLFGQIGPEQTCEVVFLVGRGESELQAIEALRPYLLSGETQLRLNDILRQRELEDTVFWSQAPQLQGDWPDYIRRGLVYDLETLRAIVRRPAGIYRYRWDAMQIQVPRVVLAEVALDMLVLSYADPETAKEVIYGTFANSPEPNVPCSREDGSYNMIATDGSPCGTAPEWCFPFHCINLVYKRTGDKEWLAKLYPLLEEYLGFWITRRVNEQGRPFYKCSWEAGQDNSARFGIKDDPSGGGAVTAHLWPVDLQAALAQASLLLSEWAAELGLAAPQWATLGDRFSVATRQMWHEGWFHDFDTRQNHFTGVLDTMQLAPLLCGVATPAQVNALMSRLANPPLHGQVFHPMMWPSIAFCLVEACEMSSRHDLAAEHSWKALASVYRWLDSDPDGIEPEKGGLPGTGREYWPQVTAPLESTPPAGGGAEGYGWGCLTTLLLLRYVIGFVEENNGFSLSPALPPELLQPGKVYAVEPLWWRSARINLAYTVKDRLEAEVGITLTEPLGLSVTSSDGQLLYQSPVALNHFIQLKISNGAIVRIVIG